MSRESPPLAGFLRQAKCLCVPTLIIYPPTVPKISAHLRHYSRFLENSAGDWVRSHCVTGWQSRLLSLIGIRSHIDSPIPGLSRINFVAPSEAHIKTSKRLAALRQIEAAIGHICRTELECAITLAAAAEASLPATGRPHVFAYLKEHPLFKKVNFNETITWPKHAKDEETKFIFEHEAAIIIFRAMSKFGDVYDDVPKFTSSGVSNRLLRGRLRSS